MCYFARVSGLLFDFRFSKMCINAHFLCGGNSIPKNRTLSFVSSCKSSTDCTSLISCALSNRHPRNVISLALTTRNRPCKSPVIPIPLRSPPITTPSTPGNHHLENPRLLNQTTKRIVLISTLRPLRLFFYSRRRQIANHTHHAYHRDHYCAY